MIKIKRNKICLNKILLIYLLSFTTQHGFAQEVPPPSTGLIHHIFNDSSKDDFKTLKLADVSNFNVVPNSRLNELPIVGREPPPSDQNILAPHISPKQTLNLNEVILIAVARHPSITSAIADLSTQNSNIRVAQAAYYPQLSGGIQTGDFDSAQRGRQVYTINASQMVYDFGKTKTNVDIQKSKQVLEQANVLIAMDQIATVTSQAVFNVLRYRSLMNIAEKQLQGLQRLYEIARLRANAGISSQADPVQAKSYVEYAQSYLITQQSNLRQQEQKLRTLLGFDISATQFMIPDSFIQTSGLYSAPQLNTIPSMIAAEAEINVAKYEKEKTKLSPYPTFSLVGSVNKALNGINPNTGRRNDTDSSIYLSMSSNFYQGGAIRAQINSANYAEQAAKAKLDAAYLNVLQSTRNDMEIIDNAQRQIEILRNREQSTEKTQELYEEQYKLGKRSILDLLSSEQSYHSSKAERETVRFDIYNTITDYIAVVGKSRDVYDLNNQNIQGFEVQP